MATYERQAPGRQPQGYTDQEKMEDVKVLHGMGYAQDSTGA